MCGLFGFAANSNRHHLDIEQLEAIAVDTESRGAHSFGLAWIDSRNRLRMFKQTGRISHHLDVLQLTLDAKLLIGHCRYATHGRVTALNAHPHPSDGGWIMHNGQIMDYRDINDRFDLAPVTECDSETLALLIEASEGTLIERVGNAMSEVCSGAFSAFAMMGLWKSPNRMIVARNGNPLHWSQDGNGVYFASLRNQLTKPKQLANGEIMSLNTRSGSLSVTTHRVGARGLVAVS